MKKNKHIYSAYCLIKPILDPISLFFSIPRYFSFLGDLINYSRIKSSEKVNFFNLQPCIHEKTKTTKFDSHYFYQDIWAFKRIMKNNIQEHFDIGSRIDFVGFLSSVKKVNFIDIRPINTELENFKSIKGDILSLPFNDDSISSLSCLHVAEHIGLGRYGDSLNPFGTEKACKELERVLARGGKLYFSIPVGKPKLCFNAHRIYSVSQIIDFFKHLRLIEFSGIDDKGIFKKNRNIKEFDDSDYSCGLFIFTKD